MRLLLSSLIAVVLLEGSPRAGELAPPATIRIPAGPFLAGSTPEERAYAYQLDEQAYGHRITREQGWYEREPAQRESATGACDIMATPVTNAEYARFVAATGHPAPDVDPATWRSYQLIHPYARTRRHAWAGIAPPAGRADHPVVLVSHPDAVAYAAWLSQATGERWRLPTESE